LRASDAESNQPGEAVEINNNNVKSVSQDFIAKKRKTDTSRKTAITKELNNDINNNVGGKNNNVGVKLICDNNNEELKKYFSKTVYYIKLETIYQRRNLP
jgi:hypothetical protein